MLGLSWAIVPLCHDTGRQWSRPPLSDDVYPQRPVGYGWLNGRLGRSAFVSAFYAPRFIRKFGRADVLSQFPRS